MTGRVPEEAINPVEFPVTAAQAWSWFIQLNNSRQQGFQGPQPILRMEMLAFFILEDIRPQPWELTALKLLDEESLKKPE